MADQEEGKSATEPEVELTEDEAAPTPAKITFPVIGIGASAGGLEALSELLEKMPGDTGAAFVIVQHLAPSKESAMPELLRRYTQMPVHQVSNGMTIEPDTIYLTPPEQNISVVNGSLELVGYTGTSIIRHPIDHFFKSLASDRGGGAVGIILSGTGTDGTDGARAIKAELGLVIVQDPEEAKYGGMPRSAMDAGLADYVLAVADIPAQVVRYIERIPDVVATVREGPSDLTRSLPQIISLLRDETGNDFSAYKENTLVRRIRRRMTIHMITDPSHYVRFLRQNPKEASALFKELLINVTSFFRDKEAFESLKNALRERLERKPPQEEIRVWVVGCATGEEAYSIAIIVREILDELGRNNNVQIFGTDLDGDAIEEARNGTYRTNIADDIEPERLRRFFTPKDDIYQVNMDIRETLVFATHNVAKEPPFLRMDLISARNLLIYLKGDLQKKLMPLFHYSLRNNGILFLGPSETVGEFNDLFGEIDRKWKVYRCKTSSRGRIPPFSLRQPHEVRSVQHQGEGGPAKTDFALLTDRIMLRHYAPPYVVIDEKDNIVYVRGDTGKYLKLAEGEASMKITEMARYGLASRLAMVIRSARTQKAEARREHVRLEGADASSIDILVRPVPGPQGQAAGYHMVIFKESPRREAASFESKGRKAGGGKKPNEKDRYLNELEQELKHSREDLQATIEELETSNEEMKSANEELLSSNEELQSTNEELETSREELRSVNEELSGLNAENLEKIEQLARAQNDMHNLLNTINIAMIYLDPDLNIKSFTPAASQIFSIREKDIGRPIGELSSLLEMGSVIDDARRVLDTLQKEEMEVRTKDGRWHLQRIQPYLSRGGEITGALLTYFDLDERRILEAALHYTQKIVDTVREPMTVLDGDLNVVAVNDPFRQLFHVTDEETLGKHIYELGDRQWDIPALKKLLEEIIPRNRKFNNFPVEYVFPTIGRRRMLLNAHRLYDDLGVQRVLLAFEDVTEKPGADPLFSGSRPKGETDG